MVAAEAVCRVVDVDLTPARADLQIAVWIEKADGTYVDTVFLTADTGRYGLGNRPGRYDFNSNTKWPYGRRINTFPVWSHKHGIKFPKVVFQNGQENELSHADTSSSIERHYCAPALPDAVTCASKAETDKGLLHASETTGYPPRQDVIRSPEEDTLSVDSYSLWNQFDIVSGATPPAATPATLTWNPKEDVTAGNYVLWIEVSREFDMNSTYNATSYPPPVVNWKDWGSPYRGQPSVLYKVPFQLTLGSTSAVSTDYVGYGDPTGEDGAVRPPDSTITIDTPGSGASRLQIVSDGGTSYRVRARAYLDDDRVPPGNLRGLEVVDVGSSTAKLQFPATGDDGAMGKVASYAVRVRANSEMTRDNFVDSMPVTTTIVPAMPGDMQTLELDGLLPDTEYWVGVVARDNCRNESDVAIAKLTTNPRLPGEVSACFVATAAYGTAMANDVELLRGFRDLVLRKTALGELAVETYYTFGPAVAGVVGESDLLRAFVRDILSPIIARIRLVRGFGF